MNKGEASCKVTADGRSVDADARGCCDKISLVPDTGSESQIETAIHGRSRAWGTDQLGDNAARLPPNRRQNRAEEAGSPFRILIQRRMRLRAFLGRTAVGVAVEGQRLEAEPMGTTPGPQMAVEGTVRCAENHASIEDRQDPFPALLHAVVPQLEVTSVFFLPVLVEIQKEIQSSIQLQLRFPVEVGMDLEESSA